MHPRKHASSKQISTELSALKRNTSVYLQQLGAPRGTPLKVGGSEGSEGAWNPHDDVVDAGASAGGITPRAEGDT